ncbi:MAG: translocation/assembly module TamB domain-containing protein [Candidatus Symbiodolus clandestinus]
MAIKRIFYLILLLGSLLLTSLWVACNTVFGLQLLFHCAANCLPGLTIQQTTRQGSELVVTQLVYQSTDICLQIDQIRLQPNVRYLKQGLLGFDSLQLQQLSLQLLQYPQPVKLTLAQLQTALQWRFSDLTLCSSLLEDLQIIWPKDEMEQAPPQQLKQPLEATAAALLQKLPARILPFWITIHIESLQGHRWHFIGSQTQEIERLQLAAEIQSACCLLHNLTLQTPEARFTLQGSLGLQKYYPLSLLLQGELLTSMLVGEQWQLRLTGALREQLTLQLHATGPLPLHVTTVFSVTPTKKLLHIQTTLRSDRLQWPIAAASPQWIAEAVRGKLEGNSTNYHFNLQAKVQASHLFQMPLELQYQDSDHLQQPNTASPHQWITKITEEITKPSKGSPTGNNPHLQAAKVQTIHSKDSKKLFQTPLELQCQGKGDTQKLQLQALQLTSPSGVAQVNGQISWQPHWQWQSQLTLDNWQVQEPTLGKVLLSGTVQSRGQMAQQQWQIELPQLQLHGELNGYPLTLTGQIEQPAYQQWHIPYLQLLLGNNRLNLQGALGTHWDLQAAVNAPKLNHLLPELTGAIMGHCTFSGTLKQPQLRSNLQISQLSWQQFSLAKATLQSELSTQQTTAGNVTLHLEKLRHPAITLDQLQLTVTGHERRHQMQVQAQGNPIAGTLRLQGAFQRSRGRWQATIDQTQLQTPIGLWQPTQVIPVSYQQRQQHFKVAAHRWRHQQTEIAISKLSYQAGTTRAQLAIQRFELSQLKPWLPSKLQLRGLISGHSHLQWSPKARLPTIGVDLQGQQLKVISEYGEKPIPLACQQLVVKLQLTPDQASFQGQLHLLDREIINTSIQVTDPQHQRQLSGNITLSSLHLLHLTRLFNTSQLPSGILKGSVRLAGTLLEPQLFGSLQLKEAFVGPLISSDPRPAGKALLLLSGQQARLNGCLPASTGELRLQGDTHWKNWQVWKSHLYLTGDPLQIDWSPDIQLTIAPNIHLESSPKHHRISGSIDIPQAKIILDQMPTAAVTVSKHEVVLNQAGRKQKKLLINEPNIDSNLILQFGDDVLLSGFGLHRVHLKGPLTVKHSSQRLGLYGQLNIIEGQLRAYGQNLLIRQGKLLFSGPVEQLLLDLEAIRDPIKTEDQVVAGLRITGFTNAPQITVFSEPSLPQTEVLSYLLNGRKQSDGQYNTIAAQLSLSALQSGKLTQLGGITQQLEQALSVLGITDLAFDTVNVGRYSQIVVTGYLKRNIQFKYGPAYGVDFQTLILRFRLMPRLYLEVLSGLEKAVDLLYQFEF